MAETVDVAVVGGGVIGLSVARGSCSSFDLPLRPSRFAEGDLTVETAVL